MVRKYKRQVGSRRYRDYTDEKLELAVHAVREGGLSYERSAKVFNIPKRTIYNKVKNRHQKSVGAQTVLDAAEERQLVDLLIASAEYGFPLTMLDLRVIVKEYLDKLGKRVQIFPNNMPGPDWCYGYLKRHKHLLTQRTCQNIKGVRAQTTEEAIEEYFDRLAESVDGIPPENLLNYDETNVSDEPGRKKCIFKRGTKYPDRILNSTKAAVSIMFAATAAGDIMPPYVVYKAERLYDKWCIGGPPGARYNRTKSGWFDGPTFMEWFETMVVPWAKKLQGVKVIIGDNLSSHLNVEILRTCQKLNIRFVFLPANTTHLTQPLDVGFFRSLKAAWREILTNHKVQNPQSSTLNKNYFPILLSQLFNKMHTKDKSIIQNAFKAAGIYPLDKFQVTKRMPKNKVQEMRETGLINEAVLDFLKEKRSPSTQPAKQKRKMLRVPPGQSISYLDMFPREGSEPEAGPSTSSKHISIDFSDDSDEDTPNIVEAEKSVVYKKKPVPGDFIVVRFATKKKLKHFIALVLTVQADSYEVKYMRKKRENMFVFPDVDDIATAFEQDLETVLEKPKIIRSIHHFKEDLSAFEL